MNRVASLAQSLLRTNLLAVGFLMALPLLYFFPVTLGQKIWYGDDIFLQWIPFGTELAVALRSGRLPLWTPGMMNGFPLFAEGQVGALYPANLVLYRFFPPAEVVSYQNLLHIIWASGGMYALARTYGYDKASALLAALVFSFNGFFITHLIHVPIIIALAWLPWIAFLMTRLLLAHQANVPFGHWFLGLTLAIAIQALAGSPHMTLLSLIGVTILGFFGTRLRIVGPKRPIWQDWVWLVLPWFLGLGIAAVQLIPTFELTQYSERASVLDYAFRTISSLPLSALAHLVSPFSQGIPSRTNNEFWHYVGILPLTLAVWALVQRSAWTIFLALLALGGWLLAIGEANPLFRFISALPILNYFRAPARFMLFFVIAVALLSATAFQVLSERLVRRPSSRWIVWAGLWVILDGLAVGAIYNQSFDFWTEAWGYLPWGLGCASVTILVLAWTRLLERRVFQTIVIGVTLFDLACFGAPFFQANSINPLASSAYVLAKPRAFVALEQTSEPYRLFTDEVGIPPFPAIRNALFPNVALIYRQESANGYTPLAYEGNHGYFLNLTATMLNLLNARYVFVPLEPTRPDGLVAPRPALRLDLTQRTPIAQTLVSGIELISFTQDADTAPQGTLIARLMIETRDGSRVEIPLRLGIETADWDYERKAAQISYAKPEVAYTFPAFWRSWGTTFIGYAYVTRITFEPKHVVGIQLEMIEPSVHLNIVALSLYDEHGQSLSLARWVGKNEFVVRYLSDTVAVWENQNAFPRAFIVHRAESFTKRLEFYRLQESSFDPERVVLLDNGPALSEDAGTPASDWVQITDYQHEFVRLAARTDRAGYLVLLDAWYPGWQAFVDGRAVPIYRADFLFRAIPLEAGEHTIVFEFRPLSLYVGALVSAVSLSLACLIALRLRKKRERLQ